jgi:hypothetical protein
MSGFLPTFTHVGSLPPISADRGVDKQGDPFNLDLDLDFFLSSSFTFVVSSSSSGHKGKRDVRGIR